MEEASLRDKSVSATSSLSSCCGLVCAVVDPVLLPLPTGPGIGEWGGQSIAWTELIRLSPGRETILSVSVMVFSSRHPPFLV